MEKQIEQDLLIRYFLGQASEKEKEEIHQWIESDEVNRKYFIRERIRFDASILVERPVLTVRKESINRGTWHIGTRLRNVASVAAAALLVLGGFFLHDKYWEDRVSERLQTVYVPAGNRTCLVLPDGTRVWLNANSTLRYPIAFALDSREIHLDGEAYFEVEKGRIPFIVRTGMYAVEVLGTTFEVEAYAESKDFRTTLYEGKVRLSDERLPELASCYLSPGQTAELKDGMLRVEPTTNPNSYRWKDGLIYIGDESFGEIMRKLEKFYGVRIVINNATVNQQEYRGKLRVSDGVDHALRVLQNDFPFKYVWNEEGNTIYIN